jgi:N-ethylmaleimide reductase
VDLFTAVMESLARRHIAYVHLVEPRGTADLAGVQNGTVPAPVAALFRHAFPGPLIAAAGFTRESAAAAIESRTADAIAFGRCFIANPDLPRRLKLDAPLNRPDASTFYGGGAAGYIDYPTLQATDAAEAAQSNMAEVALT